MDRVTQWQVVGCARKISQQHLLPVLEAVLHRFPFRIQGFHADNGSEYINHQVAQLLTRLRLRPTRYIPAVAEDRAYCERWLRSTVENRKQFLPMI